MLKTKTKKSCALCKEEIEVKKCRLKKDNFCSVLCSNKFRIGKIAWNKGKGTISSKNELIRKSVEYKLWRESVFKRDKWTCVWCKQKGGRLNADHIKPFAYFPGLRFSIDNGRTLCIDCHRKTDTYGWGTYHKKNEK